MFDEAARQKIAALAEEIGVEPAALLAVAEVESAGRAFDIVDGKDMPLIRWEGHYFYRLLPQSLKKPALAKGLAHPNAGGVPNPKSQQARYNLLKRAKEIDEVAALSSCSWGLGQVMGAHWSWLGYATVQELVTEACAGIVGQVQLMSKFIVRSKLTDELRKNNWAGFARQYNGAGYKKMGYDTKMAGAYARQSAAGSNLDPDDEDAPTVLRVGVSGVDVSQLQEKLRKLGYTVNVDGDFGPATKQAVTEFQQDHDLRPDGIAGPLTWSVIERLQGTPEDV
ncbi:N-acetylmuramidase domain-containing protein [Mesorhizobium sp. M0977]|uniref:N-acetylmuramidase domain-containing protein n=1 Tax=Mesorhizobium sp. M0977 TaxID=2957039 RepID=UPI00333D94B5